MAYKVSMEQLPLQVSQDEDLTDTDTWLKRDVAFLSIIARWRLKIGK